MAKICSDCKLLKEFNEFYKSGREGKTETASYANRCKNCAKIYRQKRYNETLKHDTEFMAKQRGYNKWKYYKERDKKYRSKSVLIEKRKKYFNTYPEKENAKNALKSIQSVDGVHRHHWSYNKEHYLDVIPLQIKDHYKAHRFLIYDQERMMYRTVDNILLDTKERHIKYIMGKIQNEPD